MEFAEDRVHFYGHRAIKASHRTTLEVTMEKILTSRGDCIIGVAADKGSLQLDRRLKMLVKDSSTVIHLKILVKDKVEYLRAFGHPSITLSHPRDIVIRKSGYICNRTLGIFCDKAAYNLSREVVVLLKDPSVRGLLHIRAEKRS